MKKRLRRKYHRKFIEEISYNVSVCSKWRGLLFSVSVGYPILIDKNTAKDLIYIWKDIKKYNLKFYVWTQKKNDCEFFFEFESEEFKSIHTYTTNPVNSHADFGDYGINHICNN